MYQKRMKKMGRLPYDKIIALSDYKGKRRLHD